MTLTAQTNAPPRYQDNHAQRTRNRINPLSVLIGLPVPYQYDPLLAVPNVPVVDERNQQVSLSEIINGFIENNRKLTPTVRGAILETVDSQASLTYPLLFPFIGANNHLVVEMIVGNQRFVSYKDTTIHQLVRCHSIPRDSSDPELHYSYVMAS